MILIVCAFACPFVGDVATAYAQQTTRFNDEYPENHDWFEADNWTNQVPDANKHAIINANLTCEIPDSPDAAALSVTIKGDATLRMEENSALDVGEDMTLEESATLQMKRGSEAEAESISVASDAAVTVKKDAVLRLGEQSVSHNSTISGTMTIGTDDHPARLRISGDHTITGDDGTILLKSDSVIDDNGHGGDELTIEGSCEVGCDEGDPPTTDCSLTVTGQGTIEVKLYNDAFVIAESGTLILDDGDKDSGCCGSWVAGPAGELHVLCDVSGSATWVADDLSAAGKFVIGDGDTDSGCVTATADVILTGGWQTVVLHVQSNGHFCTQGRLKYKSLLNEPSSPTTPQIRVETDRMAAFGVSSCSCP